MKNGFLHPYDFSMQEFRKRFLHDPGQVFVMNKKQKFRGTAVVRQAQFTSEGIIQVKNEKKSDLFSDWLLLERNILSTVSMISYIFTKAENKKTGLKGGELSWITGSQY